MKKNYKGFLSLLLSIVMVLGILPMGALAAGQLDLGLEVIARYSSNRLTWQGESGVTYQVERSADNLQWSAIGSSDTGSYLDTGAGLNTQYYYRLTAGDSGTEGVQGNVTGMHALEAIAVLFYKGLDGTVFDGTNREVIAEGEAADALNALESGTIVYKATLNDATTEQGVLGTDTDCYVGVHNAKFRHELGGGFSGEATTANMVVGANTAGFVYDDSNGHWGLCANGGNVTSIDLDESKYGMLTGANATAYYAGGSASYPLNGTINYIMVLSEVLTDDELKALTGANQDYTAPNTYNVEVYVDREQTLVLDGAVTPDTEDVEDIADVTYVSKVMGRTGTDNTFSGDYCALENCEYTFSKQSDGTWLISAQMDGVTVYVDPHAGASNGGYPNRTYKSGITLENGTDGAFKFHQLNEGYLHFWDNDDSKLYWDQCTSDSGHTGHNMLIYRRAEQGEEASAEVPGYVQVTDANAIADNGKYLILVKANSGSYYALKPCTTTSNKYQHLCKVAGTVTELTIQGTSKGSGTIYAGEYTIHVQVKERENLEISLNYNYEGAPANGTLPAISGDPIGSLPVPMRQGYTFFGWYLNGEKITSSYVVTEAVTLNADWVTVPTKEKPADGTTTNGQPFPEAYENGNAYCYRIPGIVTLADGTVVAMADARWTTYGDCGGLDTIISASKDNGKTWNYTYANYLGDNGDEYNVWSATFIDPAIATDGETVYMIADLFPAGVSTVGWGYGAQAGSSGFNADGKLILRDLAGDTYKHGNSSEKSAYLTMATSRSYDFYLDPNADGSYTIRRAADDSAVEGYRVDEMLNITSGDGTIHTHLFMADSPYQVYPTNYLYLTTSTDGLNWSAPQLIVAKNAAEASLLIGPGSGTYDAAHGNMVFTAYSYPNQKTCLLWAGKDGVWHRSEDATTNVWSSEASAVVLNNGTVRVFYRSASSTLCYTDYLWVDGEYIRDVNNTSVSTAAVKNGGNGCMLTAYKYPQKVNNEEMILVATPATPGSRNDGHIYGFYVNKDGSMELVANHDITPNDSEYYAYSCLTVLTEGEEAGDLALFWEDSWTGSPAACTIHYSVIPMEDFLAGVKEVAYKDVSLTVGKTATFEDAEGYYVGADISDLDTNVATVAITGTVTDTVTAAGEAVSAIEDGTYIIFNVRANKPMTNGAASADAGNGMSLTGTKNNVAENAIWTVKAVNGGYTVQDASGKYLTIGSNTAGVTDTETVVNIVPNGNTWTISRDGAYLNDFGGKGTCAAGWQHNDAPGDAGSQWLIYTLAEVPVAGTSEITFTAKSEGKTELQIGYVVYRITVAACPHSNTEIRDAKDATCEEPGYTGDTWCLDCGEKTQTGTEIETSAHAYVNGFCSVCDAYEPAKLNEEGIYEIGNAGQLYWFAALVNGDTDAVPGIVQNTAADAVLTADITVNQKVLENGALVSDTNALRAWTPIGRYRKVGNPVIFDVTYTGSFDGQNHTISGLYLAETTQGNYEHAALFGKIGTGADIKNVGVSDTYFHGVQYIGGIVGEAYSTDRDNPMLITNCWAENSIITANTNYVGGIVGHALRHARITECTNSATVIGGGNAGGIIGYCGDGTTVTDCFNQGTISGNSYVGGIAGMNNGGNFTKSLTRCANTGNVTGSSEIGGVVGQNSSIMEDCYNTGDVTGTRSNVGGVVGYVLNKRASVKDCYNTGAVTTGSGSNGPVIGSVASVVPADAVQNCYYLADAETEAVNGIAAKTETQFASGEVTWLLNGGAEQEENPVWKQTLTGENADATPKFEGDDVYMGFTSCADDAALIYTNDSNVSATKPDHTDEGKDHACDVCGKTVSECIDEDKDHACDICGENVGEHVAAEGSHICEYCNKPASECVDEDKNHACDICGEPMGKHEAAEGKHECEYCGEPVTECTDEDKDHECDVCGDTMGEHKDENKDHKCDYGCSESIGVCEDKDNDGKCDYGCDKEFEVKPTEPDPTDPEPTEPDVTEPDPTEPDPTEPDATEPEAPKTEGVTRLAGENRLVTSELIANQLKEKMGVEKFQNIIVASGGTFADALPGSYLAAVKNAPIVLTLAKQKYIDQTANYIKANLAEGGTVYILGGESAVPKLMEEALVGINVKRVAGADRFGTNLAILKEAGVKSGDEILVCTAKEFADSLSAAATGKPILLVYKKITDEQKTYLQTLSGNTFCVVGGTTAVPENLEEAMKAYGEVSRLAGKDRLDTSILVAKKYFPDATSSVVAYGWDFPDGLCGGSLAYATKSPLILAHSKEKLAQFTADYTVKAGLKAGYVLGGDGLVDDAATRAIFGMGSEPINLI